MEMRQKYSYECNEARVPPLLTRGARPITSVCEEAGVSRSTATNWLPRCGLVTAPPPPRGPLKWTAAATRKALVETAG